MPFHDPIEDARMFGRPLADEAEPLAVGSFMPATPVAPTSTGGGFNWAQLAPLLQLLPAAFGDPEASGALMEGFAREQARLKQLGQQEQFQAQRMQAAEQAAQARAEDAKRRAFGEAVTRIQAATADIDDPAEFTETVNALASALAPQLGMDAAALKRLFSFPTRRLKRAAQREIDAIAKVADLRAVWDANPSKRLNGRDIKFRELWELAGYPPDVPPTGPKPDKPPAPSETERRMNILRSGTPEEKRLLEQAVNLTDNPPVPRFSIIMGPDGPVRLNTQTGEVIPVTVGGKQLPPPPTTEARNKKQARERLIPAIEQMEDLGAKIITKVGPAQRALALVRGSEAVLGKDPEFRTYQDARVALAGNLAVAQQGSRPSDADIRAVWLPLIPDVFRDTKESATMKWQMIRTNMSLPAREDERATGAVKPPTRPNWSSRP